MGGNAISVSKDMSSEEVIKTYEKFKEKLLPFLSFTENEITPLGSYGKKENHQKSSDLDIAVFYDDLNKIEKELQIKGYKTKRIKGFNQISFGFSIDKNSNREIVQIDLMFTKNLEWSKFIYHSPNYIKKESKYKGAIRTILMMSILSESTRNVFHKTLEGKTIIVESKIIRLPYGIFSTRRNFMGEKGLLKKAKLMKEYDKLITNNPQIATQMIIGLNYKPKDLNSFESIWKIIFKPNFIHREYIDLILNKFRMSLKINKLKMPEEAKVIVFYPGAFKIIHGGHINLIKRYIKLSEVEEIKILISPKEREGISQNVAIEIAKNLLSDETKVIVKRSKYPSPVLTAFKAVEFAKEPGQYTLASSFKGKDYDRVLDFIKNHQPGEKYNHLLQKGVYVVNLHINAKPLLYQYRTDDKNGKPISASILRKDVKNKDLVNFRTNYPNEENNIINYIWHKLLSILK